MSLEEPTQGMEKDAASAGLYTSGAGKKVFAGAVTDD